MMYYQPRSQVSLTNLIAANQNTPFSTVTVSDCQAAINTTVADWSKLVIFAEASIVNNAILS